LEELRFENGDTVPDVESYFDIEENDENNDY
jgi:hypothetical protein